MALDFSGTGSHLVSSSASPYTYNRSFSVAGWIYADSVTGTRGIIGHGQSEWYFRINGATLNILESNTANFFSGATSLSASTWYHVGFSVSADATATIRIYLNGTEDANGTTGNTINDGSEVLCLGADIFGGGSKDERFDGRMAEMAIWGAELSAAEFASLSKGYAPTMIRPGSLGMYLPLVRGIYDAKGLDTFTGTNTSVIEHPRIIYPRRRQAFSVAAAAAPVAAGGRVLVASAPRRRWSF